MKKCKYCKSDIAEDAKVCAHCGRDQRWWDSWLIFFVLWLPLAEIVAYIIVCQIFNIEF